MYQRIAVLLLTVCLSILPVLASACTLFAAQGSGWVENGGTLIAKNRDWTPEPQSVELMTPNSGYRYYGLFSLASGKPSLRAGINEQGLVVVTATAGSIPRAVRTAAPKHAGTLPHLLTHAATVEEALQDPSLFLGPSYFMLGDKHEIAYVEIGLEGRVSITRQQNGTLAHTNHYINTDMLDFNPSTLAASSDHRYRRISELLSSTPHPFTLNDFITFSEDRTAGPDNSIWRQGATSRTQTLAAFIAYLPAQGQPELYLKYRPQPADQGQETTLRLSFAAMFAQ